MTITSKVISGVGESGCLEYAAYDVQGEPGNSRRHMFTFTTQQPCEVEDDEGTVNLIITGDQELSDILQFMKEAVKA